jgi:hypothetical protein
MKRSISTRETLIGSIKAERIRQGLSCESMDDVAGLQSGYTTKLENWRSSSGRCLGNVSLPLVLQALGLKLVLARTRPCRRHPFLATLKPAERSLAQ